MFQAEQTLTQMRKTKCLLWMMLVVSLAAEQHRHLDLPWIRTRQLSVRVESLDEGDGLDAAGGPDEADDLSEVDGLAEEGEARLLGCSTDTRMDIRMGPMVASWAEGMDILDNRNSLGDGGGAAFARRRVVAAAWQHRDWQHWDW